MDDIQAMLDDVQAILRERDQESHQALIDLHRGIEGWHRACRVRRAADQDYQLARVALRLLHNGLRGNTVRLMVHERRHWERAPAVAAYWDSVGAAGRDGWQEERRRIQAVELQAAGASDPNERCLMLDTYAVRSLMPLYRDWGQLLIDAEAVPQPV